MTSVWFLEVEFLKIFVCVCFSPSANTRVFGHFVGLDELSTSGIHPSILNLIKELEEIRHQTSLTQSDSTSPDR